MSIDYYRERASFEECLRAHHIATDEIADGGLVSGMFHAFVGNGRIIKPLGRLPKNNDSEYWTVSPATANQLDDILNWNSNLLIAYNEGIYIVDRNGSYKEFYFSSGLTRPWKHLTKFKSLSDDGTWYFIDGPLDEMDKLRELVADTIRKVNIELEGTGYKAVLTKDQ